MTSGTQTHRARGIDRVIAIFEYLHSSKQPSRISDIARNIGAPRSTAYELTNRLVEAGLLEMLEDNSVYFGQSMHYYGADYLDSKDLMKEAEKEITKLADSWGETAQFCMLDGNKYTVALTRSGRRAFRITSDVGVKVPIPWTASGRLLLQHLSPNQIIDFIPDEDFTLVDGTQLDKSLFIQEITAARENGYCVTTGLVDQFTMCMAAPIKNSSGAAVATICFVVTRDTKGSRYDDLLSALQDSAERLASFLH